MSQKLLLVSRYLRGLRMSGQKARLAIKPTSSFSQMMSSSFPCLREVKIMPIPDVRDFRAVCSIHFASLLVTPHKVASEAGLTGERKKVSRRLHFFLVGALLASALHRRSCLLRRSATTEIAEILAAHNAVRRRVARAESQRLGGTVSIPDLLWDSTVAAVAQQWADSLIKRNPPTGGHRKREELQQLEPR